MLARKNQAVVVLVVFVSIICDLSVTLSAWADVLNYITICSLSGRMD